MGGSESPTVKQRSEVGATSRNESLAQPTLRSGMRAAYNVHPEPRESSPTAAPVDRWPCTHGNWAMSTTTVSLERSAYDPLRALRKQRESLAEETLRLLGPNPPELKEFLTLMSAADATVVADRIEAARAEDLSFERRLGSRGKRNRPKF